MNVSSILPVTQTKHLKSLTPLFPYIIFNLLASCWLYLHNLFKILSLFTTSIVTSLVQTTATFCLDYFNSLLTNQPASVPAFCSKIYSQQKSQTGPSKILSSHIPIPNFWWLFPPSGKNKILWMVYKVYVIYYTTDLSSQIPPPHALLQPCLSSGWFWDTLGWHACTACFLCLELLPRHHHGYFRS